MRSARLGPARSVLRRWLLRAPRLFVLLCAPNDAELGALGEEAAASYLARRGWRIVARRLRTRAGEADLVALRGQVLAVVEVKTGRRSSVPIPAGRRLREEIFLRWRPGSRCGARAIARLAAVARVVASDRGMQVEAARTRVDLVEVFLEEPSRRLRILHHEDLRKPVA